MLTLFNRHRFRQCDGIDRRTWLQMGGLALGGLTLPQLLERESHAGINQSHKSVIMIYLTGGPPHQDMVDLKPQAPSDVRGEFQPIDTNVSGVQISEHLPLLSQMMDRLVVIRTLTGSDGRHSSFQCVTGRHFRNQPRGGWPGLGSVVSQLQGTVDPSVPPSVNLFMKMAHLPYNHPGSGFLGSRHMAFQPDGQGHANMKLNGITVDRLDDRRTLLRAFDGFRSQVDRRREKGHLDPFTEQAFDVLTASRLADALDLDREDPKVRSSYGEDAPGVLSYGHLGYQAIMSKFLLARRLVQAGVRTVTTTFADFDWHGGNFSNGRKVLPLLDQGLAALINDLYRLGLQDDVTVVVWGEFGRTPKVNKSAGRDHWPRNAFAILAGGGMPTGQGIGTTTRYAEEAQDRPVHFQEVFATLYRNLGIDMGEASLTDLNGRPHYLLDDGYKPLPELI